jgi:methyltransferase-like protein
MAYRHNKTTYIVTPEPERYKAVLDFYSERYSQAIIVSDIGTHAKTRTHAHTHT